MRTSTRLASSFLFAAVTAGCGGGSHNPPPGGAPASAVVGTSGGGVTSSDGNIAVTVPAGALGGNVTITVEPATTQASGAVGTVYEIGPTGTQFAMPVTLTLHYDDSMLGSTAASSLRVATFASGTWQLLPGATVDTQAKTVSGLTTHLSPYAIVAVSSGRTCAQIQAGLQCSSTATGGSSAGFDAGAGATNTGAPKTDGTTPTCTAPTCAGATNACSAYPGAELDGCTDGANGYTAACCFPSGGPICFAIGAAGQGCDAAGTGGASGTTACPPAPTCATATNACAGYPGATLQNCVDGQGGNGYTGACCFDPGSPICVSVSAARFCPTGTSCPTPPRCADADPCAGYAGATTGSCTDTADGYQAACCFPVGTLPSTRGASGAGGATNADGGTSSGTGAGGDPGTGGGTGGITGSADAGTPPPQDSGTPPPPDSGAGAANGGGTCQPGAACQPGAGCAAGDPTTGACLTCNCDSTGTLACTPCPGKDGGVPSPDGGTGGTTGGGTCQPGAACQPGAGCATGDPTTGACLMCNCDSTGTLACAPCPGKDGGAPPPSDGGATATCQASTMPSTGSGTPCGVMESCPDGSVYRVRCDGVSGQCTCMMNATMVGTITMACDTLDAASALTACKFPTP